MIPGKKINLRFVKEGNLEIMAGFWENIEERGGGIPIIMRPESELRKRFAENNMWTENHGQLLITDKDDNVVGQISFWKPYALPMVTALEIGYVIYKPEDRGKGYTSEAVGLFVGYLFATKQINRIQAGTMVDNKASQKVLEKNGFKHEGTVRQLIFHMGEMVDLEMYSILRDEAQPMEKWLTV